jgi:DNA-binding phage protein
MMIFGTPAQVAVYLAEALKTMDAAFIWAAIRTIARAMALRRGAR